MAFFLATALLCLASGAALRERRLRRRAEAEQLRTLEREAALRRLLRLAATELRGLTLTLLGYAQTGRDAPDGAISGLGGRFLALSEDLIGQTETPDAPRHLVDEAIPVRPIVEFAVARVAAQLGPARRAWRIADTLRGCVLLADRRALNHILVNVLASAATATKNGDWIDISAEIGPSKFVLVVQDEGVGLPVPRDFGLGQESRGLGLGLALARSLMEAHGGLLGVESTAQVGTHVRLGFPIARLVAEDPETGEARTPSPGWAPTPSPGWAPTPSPGGAPTPSPGRALQPSRGAEHPGENLVHRP